MSYFRPTGPDTFTFEAKSADGSFMEGRHRGWIKQYLTDNHMCPNGFTITKTQKIVADTSNPFGTVYEFVEDGKCNV
jgi:hypothetical protein